MLDQEAFFTSPIAGHHTLRDVAATLGVPLDRVVAAVDRARVPPACRRGVVRLWSDEQVEAIRAALAGPVSPVVGGEGEAGAT